MGILIQIFASMLVASLWALLTIFAVKILHEIWG